MQKVLKRTLYCSSFLPVYCVLDTQDDYNCDNPKKEETGTKFKSHVTILLQASKQYKRHFTRHLIYNIPSKILGEFYFLKYVGSKELWLFCARFHLLGFHSTFFRDLAIFQSFDPIALALQNPWEFFGR